MLLACFAGREAGRRRSAGSWTSGSAQGGGRDPGRGRRQGERQAQGAGPRPAADAGGHPDPGAHLGPLRPARRRRWRASRSGRCSAPSAAASTPTTPSTCSPRTSSSGSAAACRRDSSAIVAFGPRRPIRRRLLSATASAPARDRERRGDRRRPLRAGLQPAPHTRSRARRPGPARHRAARPGALTMLLVRFPGEHAARQALAKSGSAKAPGPDAPQVELFIEANEHGKRRVIAPTTGSRRLREERRRQLGALRRGVRGRSSASPPATAGSSARSRAASSPACSGRSSASSPAPSTACGRDAGCPPGG